MTVSVKVQPTTSDLSSMLEQLEAMQSKVKQARAEQKEADKAKAKAKQEAIVKARKIMREYKISPAELSA